MKPTHKLFMIVGSVAVIGAAGWTGYALFATPDTTKQSPSMAQSVSGSTTASTLPTNTAKTTTYRDGTYNGSVSYRVPHGSNTLQATVTIAGGTISDVKVQSEYSDQESQMYVDSFASSISSSVKGHSLGDVSVSRVGGASLTSDAFNAVLDTIRSDAKAS